MSCVRLVGSNFSVVETVEVAVSEFMIFLYLMLRTVSSRKRECGEIKTTAGEEQDP